MDSGYRDSDCTTCCKSKTMREIKFRAWDTSDVEKGPYMLGPYDLTDAIFSHTQVRRMPLMQYTGLKDKNGVEIYEGDIVEWWDSFGVSGLGNDSFSTRMQVKYEHGAFEPVAGLIPADMEVLGNYYQNPELLNP
jgi:hypothetical protein